MSQAHTTEPIITRVALRLPDSLFAYWVSVRAPHTPVHRLLGWEGEQPVVCDPEHPYRPNRKGYAVGAAYLLEAEPMWCRKCCANRYPAVTA